MIARQESFKNLSYLMTSSSPPVSVQVSWIYISTSWKIGKSLRSSCIEGNVYTRGINHEIKYTREMVFEGFCIKGN